MNKCSGILSALMTPFTKNGKLDEKVLRKYIRHNIDRMKVDGLYVGGSTGEGLLMSKDERMAVLEITKEEVAGKIPLIAHVGTLNLNEACEMAQKAEELEYDLISAVTPYYYPFSFADISKYYNTILKSTSKVPLVIYFLPSLSNNSISLDDFGKLFEDKSAISVDQNTGLAIHKDQNGKELTSLVWKKQYYLGVNMKNTDTCDISFNSSQITFQRAVESFITSNTSGYTKQNLLIRDFVTDALIGYFDSNGNLVLNLRVMKNYILYFDKIKS